MVRRAVRFETVWGSVQVRRAVLDATVQLIQGDAQDGARPAQEGLLKLWASIVIPFVQDAEPTVHEAAMTEVRCAPPAAVLC